MKRHLPALLLSASLLLTACGGATPASPTQPAASTAPAASPATAVTAPSPSPTTVASSPSPGMTSTAGMPTPGTTATAAATSAATVTRPTGGAVKQLRVALLVTGTLGDKGFWDSAKAGVDRAQAELGAQVQTVEFPNAADWQPALAQLAQGGYDIIVLGGFDMIDALNVIAPQFPDTKFIFFDATVDQPNVANITYAQNEASFLAGVLAACAVNNPEIKNKSGKKVVGAVGGMDIPVINDFIVGYNQGAKYADPSIRVLKSYAGTWEDPAKGKELARDQFQQGADVVFAVAGKTGLGVLEAAKDANRYAIGVDANQNAEQPGHVLTSVLKRVDNSVFDLLQIAATGTLQTGKTYTYGIENNGVGLAEDDLYRKYVPQACRDQVNKAKEDVASGKVRVDTAFK